MSEILFDGVVKRYGEVPVLADLELEIVAGSTTAILGASGSGKTTMLRLIAGFERPDAGSVSIAGRIVDDGHTHIPPQRRGIGYVPQDGALFPHLTVRSNVAFGLARAERGRADELLGRVGLGDLGRRYPHELSGGEQQRVALARALAIEPRVVLLDEPFNALDASLRTHLAREIVDLLRESSTTTVLVTHDREEALTLSDTVAVLASGRIVAVGDPRTLYQQPVDLTAARSVGETNVIPARCAGGRAQTALGEIPLRPQSGSDADDALVLLRPEQLRLTPCPIRMNRRQRS